MKNVLHKNNFNLVALKVHVDTTLITLTKLNSDEKLYKYCVNFKLCRDPKSIKLDIYESKISLFDNGKSEELLLLILGPSNNFLGVSKAHCWRKYSVSSYDSIWLSFT